MANKCYKKIVLFYLKTSEKINLVQQEYFNLYLEARKWNY